MLVPVRTSTGTAPGNNGTSPSSRVSAETWLLTGIVIVGAAVRFASLGTQSYWFDEAQAAHEAHLSFGALLGSLGAHESNPPLYFMLAWLWAKLFGNGEVGLRSLSALAGIAVIPLAYLCGRELISRRAGVIAAAFAALNPFMIWYSQEAREYALLAAFCAASLLFFGRALRVRSTREVLLWAVFSGLAVLTHSFAGFLVAPEALWLLYAVRRRATVLAVGAVALVQLALVPMLVNHASDSLLGFIHATPLSLRLRELPVSFGLGPLDHSSIVAYGLLGAAALAGAVIVLLVIGASSCELRGAGLAAGVFGFVVLAPLGLALIGTDYYISRALMPAWIPLAVIVAGACAARRTRAAGATLTLLLLGGFVYADVKFESDARYQRPDWRGVAAALGHASSRRAIVAYDGLATDSLTTYLPRIPWTATRQVPVTVSEVDVVGSRWQKTANPLPRGTTMISSGTVNDYLVERFRITPPLTLTPVAIAARAEQLLGPAPPGPAVLIQSGTA
jgi:mannosyltransferase